MRLTRDALQTTDAKMGPVSPDVANRIPAPAPSDVIWRRENVKRRPLASMKPGVSQAACAERGHVLTHAQRLDANNLSIVTRTQACV